MPIVQRTLTLDEYNDDTGKELNAFLNSLFDPWPGPFAQEPGPLFRAGLVGQIKAAEENDAYVSPMCWLIDDSTRRLIVNVLEGYWYDKPVIKPQPRVIKSDYAFITLVRNYVDKNKLELSVPGFLCKTKQAQAPSTYTLRERIVLSFKKDGEWDREVVRDFLELLLAGAHFVVVQSATDLGNDAALPNFTSEFCKLDVGTANHSHYSAIVATDGRSYPVLPLIEKEGPTLDQLKNPEQAVLLPVVLCDWTSHQDPNSFFQMEGWRIGVSMFGVSKYEYRNPPLLGGYRHGADFSTHGQTIWNISTYGASLFSEKRGASVFLAPKAWMTKKTSIYQGFGGPNNGHKWFNTKLVEGV